MATTELKSCLKKPGAPRRDLPPTSFSTEVTVVGPDNTLTVIPMNEKRGRKKSDAKRFEQSKEDDLTVDVSKYLVKSIYDSSSEEEPAEDTSPTSKKVSKKDSKADKKEKKEKQKADKASRKANERPFPGVTLHEEVRAKKKLSLSERFRRKKKLKSQMKGVKVFCAPKELVDAVVQLGLTPDERIEPDHSAMPLKEPIMEGFSHIKLPDLPGKPMNCRFIVSGNGVIDFYQTSMADGVIEFLYLSSIVPIFLADVLHSSNQFLDLEESKSSASGTLNLEGFPCPSSSEIDEETWSPPGVEERRTVLILFSSSSDRVKFLSVVSPFFIESPYEDTRTLPNKRNLRQASVRNIGRVLRKKSKGKLGSSEPRAPPFPGIALHLEPGNGGTDRPFRTDSAPEALVDKPRVEAVLTASISDPEIHAIPREEAEELAESPTKKKRKKKKRTKKTDKEDEKVPDASPSDSDVPE